MLTNIVLAPRNEHVGPDKVVKTKHNHELGKREALVCEQASIFYHSKTASDTERLLKIYCH